MTASVFHDVFTHKEDASALVSRYLKPNDVSTLPAIKWGVANESTARDAYAQQMSHTHVSFECRISGLVVHPLYPCLGASPDGVTCCGCCGEGICEIKCPFSIKDVDPNNCKGKPKFFLKEHGLNTTHKYYTQVQGQLAICDKQFCDFVVWTAKGLFIQRIYRDKPFWEKVSLKLSEFYVKHFLPKAIEESSLFVGAEKFCFCHVTEHGEMVFCDNPNALLDGTIFHVWDCNSHLRVHGTVLNVMEHCNVHVYVQNCNHMMYACLQCMQLYQFT